MKCPDCGTEMKPLATSVYCPNDCDRKVREEIDPEKTPRIIFFDAKAGAKDVIHIEDLDIGRWWDKTFDDSTD